MKCHCVCVCVLCASDCSLTIIFHSAEMPRKERRLKQKQKELREAAKGSGSLTSWMTKSLLSHALSSVYTMRSIQPTSSNISSSSLLTNPPNRSCSMYPWGKTETNFALHWPLTNIWVCTMVWYMLWFHVIFFMNMGCYNSTACIARYASVSCFKCVLHVPLFLLWAPAPPKVSARPCLPGSGASWCAPGWSGRCSLCCGRCSSWTGPRWGRLCRRAATSPLRATGELWTTAFCEEPWEIGAAKKTLFQRSRNFPLCYESPRILHARSRWQFKNPIIINIFSQ